MLCKNRFDLFLIFFNKFTKINIKSFDFPKSKRNYKANNVWNIRRLIDKSFVPASQGASEPGYYIVD